VQILEKGSQEKNLHQETVKLVIGIRLKLLKLFGSDVQFQLRNRILVNQNVS